MPRPTNRLTTRAVSTLKVPGRHADGGGLYLQVDESLAKRWVFVFQWCGRRREMGLGSAAVVDLKEARDAAMGARKLVQAGHDPIAARRAKSTVPTFGEMADELTKSLSPTWRNDKHRSQWKTSLEGYAKKLRPIRVTDVTTSDVLAVLQPIWSVVPETAARTRGRIERVLDAARAKGHIPPPWENPARWKGHLSALLPPRQRLTRGHLPAMPFEIVPEFVRRLREREAVAARALEFTVLTAVRSGETLFADWDEIDLPSRMWVIPKERTKTGIEHRVPLSPGALEVLERVKSFGQEGLVFPGQKKGRPLSNMAMEMLLRRMACGDACVHGFRSSFRDWVGETTSFARELAEAALGHLVGNAVERAYRRGDALEKRRTMMEAWSTYCLSTPGMASHDVADAA